MKKLRVLITIVILVFCLLVTACSNNSNVEQNNDKNNTNSQNQINSQNKEEQKETQKEEKKINEEYDVAEEIKGIIEDTRLNGIETLNEIDKVANIDFSDLKGVTYEHIEEIAEKEITEVWLIKMSDFNQYNKIVEKLNESLEDLKTKYSDNKFITAILNSKDNIRIQEKEGIVMAVFAPDAGALISGIERSFNKETEIPVSEESGDMISGEAFEENTGLQSGEIIE